MAGFGEGDAKTDFTWIFIIFVLLGFVWYATGGPEKDNSHSLFLGSTPGHVSSDRDDSTDLIEDYPADSVADKTKPTSSSVLNGSPYKGQIDIRLGQSYRKTGIVNNEYLIIKASSRNKESINISGWKIDNGYSGRYSDFSGKNVVGRSTIVTIPYGTVLLTAKGVSALGPILLGPGETAYVVTGSVIGSNPYKIDSSFKVNKCSGYLEKYDGYNFVPTIYQLCPAYDKELNVSSLSDACEDYVKRYGRNCATPEVTHDDENGGILVDGKKMSSACRSTIVSTFNYESCVSRHKLDKDFLSKQWYVFLRHQGGLYAQERATVTLYDSYGKVVDTYSY